MKKKQNYALGRLKKFLGKPIMNLKSLKEKGVLYFGGLNRIEDH